MLSLKSTRKFAGLVLAWFALTLGVAGAGPWVNPARLDVVCSASGAALVAAGEVDTKGSTAVSHHLNCPLCLTFCAPPPQDPEVVMRGEAPRAFVPPLAAAAPTAWRSTAPLPARGPPFSV